MSMRLKRLEADYAMVKQTFDGHSNIIVEPLAGDPPEKYRVTYYLKGIYKETDGSVQLLDKHIVEISLHAEYPRFKPVCTILTPIWHPNFRDGQICIGDIWGAGESLADIIVNIGDMIQYKSWNSFSPLSADAAKWAMENKTMFPIGHAGLYRAEVNGKPEAFDIDLLDEERQELAQTQTQPMQAEPIAATLDFTAPVEIVPVGAASVDEPPVAAEALEPAAPAPVMPTPVPTIARQPGVNDFEITPAELSGIEYIPTAQKMHNMQQQLLQGRKVNFKTIFTKGILYGLLGGIVGWGISELCHVDTMKMLASMGLTQDTFANFTDSQITGMVALVTIFSTAVFSGVVGALLGALLGVGEGAYYGSGQKAVKYAFIGLGISLVLSTIGGVIAQIIYSNIMPAQPDLTDPSQMFAISIYRAIAWAAMGLATGFATGLIKPTGKRILNCSLGGLLGGFIGGFIFNYINTVIVTNDPTTDGIIARAIGIAIMGLLVGLGVGLLEQFAKSAWLKVTRGEFEGKEYLVFAGTTSIGNSGKNTIVLFKDKLVSPAHCEIRLVGSKYELWDKGSPTGTIVNGMRVTRHVLRKGDQIALGNTVLQFNTK